MYKPVTRNVQKLTQLLPAYKVQAGLAEATDAVGTIRSVKLEQTYHVLVTIT